MHFFLDHHESKLPNVKTTIFTTMSRLAIENNAINLSQGFPDFDCPKLLLEETQKALTSQHDQYAPMAGALSLREEIAKKTEKCYQQTYCPESEITVTAGATQALYTAISAFIKPKDEVIVIRPAYDCYEPAIKVNGGVTINFQLSAPDYNINWEEFSKIITSKTKMIILNSPNNPSGTILNKSDMLALEKIIKNTSILLLCDDVYEHIIYDGNQHQSACMFPELKKRALICSSFGKTYHITGWKIGYCLAPEGLMDEFRKVHQYNVFSVHHPSQIALANFLEKSDDHLELQHFYQDKRDFFLKAVQGSKFDFTPTQGTYFQLLDYSKITAEKDIDYAKRLVKENKIAAIPFSPFNTMFNSKVLRFCFAKKNDTLEKAAEILCKIN
jgi:methionine aminotransferase